MIAPASPANIAHAANILAADGLVGMPTETVYGLAADAISRAAVAGIYAAKGRPADHPVIVHLAPQSDVAYWVRDLPPYAAELMRLYWPGPLTLVCPRTAQAPDWVTGGQDTVGIRCPSHPVAQALLSAALSLGVQGIAAPSANRFGRVSPTTAGHVEGEFGGAIYTLDGGACAVGIESTIVDCTQAQPRVLRHGSLDLTGFLGIAGTYASQDAENKPRVSGGLAAHYAPHTRVVLADLQATGAENLPQGAVYMARSKPEHLPPGLAFYAMPESASDYAHALYASLRELDTLGYSIIVVQPVPTEAAWLGVADRLARAAASFA